MNVCALIPSYNEERNIGEVVKRVRDKGIDVIVVDDGSTDGTEREAKERGACVLKNPKNLGKGAALSLGFDHILNKTECEAVIVMDGDGQHDPDDIDKFIERAKGDSTDIIVGNRMGKARNMPFVRRKTNEIMSSVISSICKQDIPDTQCGYRLIKRRVISGIKLDSKKFDFETEMLIKASRMNCRISSVPVDTIYGEEKSHINPILDTLRFINLLLRSRNK